MNTSQAIAPVSNARSTSMAPFLSPTTAAESLSTCTRSSAFPPWSSCSLTSTRAENSAREPTNIPAASTASERNASTPSPTGSGPISCATARSTASPSSAERPPSSSTSSGMSIPTRPGPRSRFFPMPRSSSIRSSSSLIASRPVSANWLS